MTALGHMQALLQERNRLHKNLEWRKKPLQEKYEDLKQYKSVFEQYFMPCRYIIDRGQFDEEVFNRYLKYRDGPSKNREADYAKWLWRKKHPHGSIQQANEIRARALATMRTATPDTPKETAKDTYAPEDIAQNMWDLYLKLSKDPDWMAKELKEKQVDFRVNGFTDFMKQYMVVSRYIISYGEFNLKAFKIYLKKLKAKGAYKSKDDWAETEASYAGLLWRAYNPHASEAQCRAIRSKTAANLIKEMDSFKDDYEKAKKKTTEAEEVANRQVKQDLVKMSQNDPEIMEKLRQIYIRSQTPKTDDNKSSNGSGSSAPPPPKADR